MSLSTWCICLTTSWTDSLITWMSSAFPCWVNTISHRHYKAITSSPYTSWSCACIHFAPNAALLEDIGCAGWPSSSFLRQCSFRSQHMRHMIVGRPYRSCHLKTYSCYWRYALFDCVGYVYFCFSSAFLS